MLQVLNEMKIRKATGPSEVSLGLIAASVGVEIQLMAEVSKKVLDSFWNASRMVSKNSGSNL